MFQKFSNVGLPNTVFALFVCSGLSGCGGEDFSAPPANLTEIRENAKAKAQANKGKEDADAAAAAEFGHGEAGNESGDDTSNPSLLSEAMSAKPDGGGQQDVDGSKTDAESQASASDVTDTTSEGSNVEPRIPSDPKMSSSRSSTDKADTGASAKNSKADADADSKVVTTGGKTKAEVEKDRKENNTVAKSGISLLDKVRGEDEKKTVPNGRVRVQHTVKRTGRLAVAAEVWFRLRNQLAKRFYVAATANGSKIAASFGERSLGVLSTRVEVLGEELNWTRRERTVSAIVTERKEVTTQPVDGLPGIITALDLIQNGDVVLIGTADGRLMARSCANLQDWDIYAQDLFAWQDKYRPSTRISDVPVVVVRSLSDNRLLTVDDDGQALIWETSVVVNKPVNPLEMSEDQARSPEAPTITAKHLTVVDLPKSKILSFAISKSKKYGLVVTSDEHLTVFQTEDGRIVGSLNAAQFDDTQPVCAFIEEDYKRVLVGLADGRIVRRALPGGEPVSGTTDDGVAVDYEVVSVPDVGDRSGAITSLEVNDDGSLLYIGRLTGTVAQFDLPRKQQQRIEKLHAGPVLEMRSTPVGLFTVGEERVAKLSYIPDTTKRRPSRTFQLPKDALLKSKDVIERPEAMKQDKFTVRRNFDQPVSASNQKGPDFIGIRSSNPVLALYEHQLRVAADEKLRREIREKVAAIKNLKEPESTKRSYGDRIGAQVAEVQTEFDFQSRPLRRVVMSVSNDGATLAAAQYDKGSLIRGPAPDQPVVVWDTYSKTKLRTWPRSMGVCRLHVDAQIGHVLPTPLSARMGLYSGDFLMEQMPSLSSQISGSDQWLAVGLTGRPGTASNVVSLIGQGKTETRSGLEAFEGAVPVVAWSHDDRSLYVSLRERTRARLLELEIPSLTVRHEIEVSTVDGRWDVDKLDVERTTMGATRILPSPTGKLLVTYGKYPSKERPFQLRIWQKSGDKWGEKPEAVIGASKPMLEAEMTDTQLVFVNQQDAQIALTGPKGIGVIDSRKGRVSDTLELPDVGNRRPATAFSPDGKLVCAGDREGNIWVWELRSLKRDPKKFTAHPGPITGLAVSANSRFLVTAGEENRIRVWDLAATRSPPVQSVKR